MLNPKGCKLITLSRWNIAKQSGDVRGTSASRWQKKLNSWSSKPVMNCPTKSLQHLAALPNGGCSNGLVPTLCWKLCSASQSTLAFATAQRRNYKASQPWLQFCLLTEFNVLYTLYTHTVKSAKRHLLIV